MPKNKYHPGYRFGNMTIVEKTDLRKGNYVIWKCRCDCGKEVLMDTRLIERETRLHCGCKDFDESLRGKTYHTYKILEPAYTENYQCYWKCRCECGEEFVAPQKQLSEEIQKLCPSCHGKFHNLKGQRFGSLTALERGPDLNGKIQWKCRCDCGNEVVVLQNLLVNGKKRSCGCLQSQMGLRNLRLCDGTSVSKLESSRNRRLISSNSSGYNGIYKVKRTGKWAAQITFKNKTYFLGSFSTLEEAVEARENGEKIYSDFLKEYYAEHSSGETAAGLDKDTAVCEKNRLESDRSS